jgi:hypothetical protein
MRKLAMAAILLAGFALAGAQCDNSAGNGSGNSTAEGPNPGMTDPDQVAWQLFTQVTTPAGGGLTFQGWASDTDTFQPNAQWPTGAATQDGLDARPAVIPTIGKTGSSMLGAPRRPTADAAPDAKGAAAATTNAQAPAAEAAPAEGDSATNAQAPASTRAVASAAAPAPAPGNSLENFPPPPTTEPGASSFLIEEVRRNQPAFDYIVSNNLNSLSGLKTAFANTMTVSFPVDAIEVKTNWLPVSQLKTYYPTAQASDFYVTKENGVDYALIAMHINSKQVPNWTWATFEHQLNPGRCDYMGCHDAFGATVADVPAADNQGANQGTTYANCEKTPALQAMMSGAGLPAVFANYCLKGAQTEWTDNNGLAIRVANSVTEYTFAQLGSCMTCHGMANFDENGKPTTNAGFDPNAHIGPIDPKYYWNLAGGGGPPYYEGQPGITRRAVSADFVWSIPFCAYDDVTNPQQPAASNCAGK